MGKKVGEAQFSSYLARCPRPLPPSLPPSLLLLQHARTITCLADPPLSLCSVPNLIIIYSIPQCSAFRIPHSAFRILKNVGAWGVGDDTECKQISTFSMWTNTRWAGTNI